MDTRTFFSKSSNWTVGENFMNYKSLAEQVGSVNAKLLLQIITKNTVSDLIKIIHLGTFQN